LSGEAGLFFCLVLAPVDPRREWVGTPAVAMVTEMAATTLIPIIAAAANRNMREELIRVSLGLPAGVSSAMTASRRSSLSRMWAVGSPNSAPRTLDRESSGTTTFIM
jgi:hypothetical protein